MLVNDLLELLGATEVDMTMFFRLLCSMTDPDVAHTADAFYEGSEPDTEAWNQWLNRWWIRVDGEPDREGMRQANPKYVLRNWMAQLAIDAAEERGDFSIAEQLHELLKRPYEEQPEHEAAWFQNDPNGPVIVGCSMLSCSS